ncbi:uncharacterized protein F5891DRAFT_1191045 [Suillus fuscotomentosus]|uniref:DUF6533 domain-containing protein n=1 Tax=Suillus fuscotomentosus TaxID=1912939 RepID=A0AAD4HJ28_9AGAM|nr:uncharacterized protein F5891DRAFT_1191045 [Suillus fuscotomentosus]KAG1898362.1 hypothetical protein F5891DRAFT_1191045 [Suillus fuscotomentosus]
MGVVDYADDEYAEVKKGKTKHFKPKPQRIKALTFGQEVELIWRQRWSLMTAMYLGALPRNLICWSVHSDGCSDYLIDRHGESSAQMLAIPLQLTVVPCSNVSWIIFVVWDWMGVVVIAMLWVIIIARLNAMYQGSRKILIFLIVTFLAINTFDAVVAMTTTKHTSGEELILSGTYQCQIYYPEDIIFLDSITWILGTVWEVIALCLAVWIAIKHLREMRQHSAGGIIQDYFTMLMKTHVVYSASFVAVSCVELIAIFSPTLSMADSLDTQIIYGFLQISQVVQMFVLGSRLILGVREYHAKLVADSDAATGMISIAFQERVHISTGNGV